MNYFMRMDKTYLATILELFDPNNIFDILDWKYSVFNSAHLCQLFCKCQVVSIQKNVRVIEKYKSILDFNVKIRMQKPKLVFWNKYLINFHLASIFFTYEGIIDNLNMRNILMLEEIVCAFYTKKIELTNLEIIKEESMYFAAQGRFCGGWGR